MRHFPFSFLFTSSFSSNSTNEFTLHSCNTSRLIFRLYFVEWNFVEKLLSGLFFDERREKQQQFIMVKNLFQLTSATVTDTVVDDVTYCGWKVCCGSKISHFNAVDRTENGILERISENY